MLLLLLVMVLNGIDSFMLVSSLMIARRIDIDLASRGAVYIDSRSSAAAKRLRGDAQLSRTHIPPVEVARHRYIDDIIEELLIFHH